MRHKFALAWTLGAAMMVGGAGCASTSWNWGNPFAKSEPKATLPIEKPPGPSKPYGEYLAEQRKPITPPKLGGEPEKGTMARMASAVTESKAVKSVKGVFTRKSDKPTLKGTNLEGSVDAGEAVGVVEAVELAQQFERTGNTEAAVTQYQNALKIDGKNFEALLGYARLEDRRGNLVEATKIYQQAAKLHPQQPTVFNDLALCLTRQQRIEEAVAAMNQAIALEPSRKLYRNNMAKMLVEAGRYDQALLHLVAVHPPAPAHYNLGYLLSQRGDDQAAYREFSKAYELDPTFADARQWMENLASQTTPAAEGLSATDPSSQSTAPMGDAPAPTWRENAVRNAQLPGNSSSGRY